MEDRQWYKTIGENTIKRILEGHSKNPIVLVFTTEWLGASQILDTFFEDLAFKFRDELQIYRCNIAEINGLNEEIGVERIPTTLIIKDGVIIDYFTGVLSKKRIREKLEALL